MASSEADDMMASDAADDLLFDLLEPDPQKAATDDALQPHPDDWASYSDDAKLAAPRGAVFETRLAASAALRELGNERYRANNFGGGARRLRAESLASPLRRGLGQAGIDGRPPGPALRRHGACALELRAVPAEDAQHLRGEGARRRRAECPRRRPNNGATHGLARQGLLLRATCLREAGRYDDAAAALDFGREPRH